jgi:hypothetical protein
MIVGQGQPGQKVYETPFHQYLDKVVYACHLAMWEASKGRSRSRLAQT